MRILKKGELFAPFNSNQRISDKQLAERVVNNIYMISIIVVSSSPIIKIIENCIKNLIKFEDLALES